MKNIIKLFACTAITMLVLTSCGKTQPESPAAEPPVAELPVEEPANDDACEAEPELSAEEEPAPCCEEEPQEAQ